MTPIERPQYVTPADHVPGPQQGHWTYSHYAAIPDDGQRYEIVDGVLYMSPAPSKPHQRAVVRITHYLLIHVDFAHIGEVLTGPFDVELAFDAVVQPDVLVFLNENSDKCNDLHFVGGPDLVVEVISPGTAKHDRQRKFNAYAKAGVKEYWIVHPRLRNVEVFALEAGAYCRVGVFSGEQTLPTTVVPGFPVQVQQFFA